MEVWGQSPKAAAILTSFFPKITQLLDYYGLSLCTRAHFYNTEKCVDAPSGLHPGMSAPIPLFAKL